MICAFVFAQQAMWDEALFPQRPEKHVDVPGFFGYRGMDEHAATRTTRFFCDSAREVIAVAAGIAVEYVEVDLCHGPGVDLPLHFYLAAPQQKFGEQGDRAPGCSFIFAGIPGCARDIQVCPFERLGKA